MKYLGILIISLFTLGACSKSVTESTDPIVLSEKIVFQSNRDGNREIYCMNSDGSNPINLTNNSAQDRDPSSSPDGNKIVFRSNRDGNYEIYCMNVDGSNLVRLTNTTANEYAPTWSPDGTKIVYTSNSEIYTMNANGTNQVQLTTNGSNDYPSWRGAYIYYNHDGAIWRMASDGTGQAQIFTDGTDPIQELSISPDGTKMLYVRVADNTGGLSATEVFTCNINGSNIVRLTNSVGEDGEASWSADGSKIVFMTCRSGSSTYNIAIMSSTGASQTVLTTTNSEYKPCFVGQPR